MRALITSLHFTGLTGSELVALEIMEGLSAIGLDISVFSYAYSEGFVEHFKHCGFSVLEDDPSLWEYDLVWSQHGIWCKLLAELPIPKSTDDLMPLIAPVSLSPYEEAERIPMIPAKILGLTCWVNSEETANIERARLGHDCKVKVFSNAAPLHFRHAETSVGSQDEIKRESVARHILIVSNHPPRELVEAVDMIHEGNKTCNKAIYIDWVGESGDFKRITPSTIRKYDAVVSIGKTVQYCICLGIPIYVYDQCGGPGWLQEDIYEKCKCHNFSGRPWPAKSSLQISTELRQLPIVQNKSFEAKLNHDADHIFNINKYLEEIVITAKDRNKRLEAQEKYIQSMVDSPCFFGMLSEIGRLHSYIHRLQPLAIRDLAAYSARKLVTSKDQLSPT